MNSPASHAHASSRGFSIVEFMVALLLGTVLIGGAISVYLASTRSFQESERSVQLLDNGRFALQILGDSLRHAGFFAGVDGSGIDEHASLGTVTDDCAGDAAAWSLDSYLVADVAVDLGGGMGGAFGCIDDAVPGTDVLVIKAMVPDPFSDADPNDPTATRDGAISFPAAPDANTTYILANAELGMLVKGANMPSVSDGQTYARGQAWPYSFQVFYIRLLDDRPAPQPDIVALARKRLAVVGGSTQIVTENLVLGVADMRIRFRYDSDDDGDVDTAGYEDDLSAADWNRIGSVEIFLLAQSLERDLDYLDQKTYTLGDRTLTPNDNLWRMLANQHFNLRNPHLVIHGGGV